MSDELWQRLDYLLDRLRTAYDSIGHSSGRPYIYFVYPPGDERFIARMIVDHLHSDARLVFHPIDILPLTIESLAGQEELRQQSLNDPLRSEHASHDILRLWARRLRKTIEAKLATTAESDRPVVVLYGLAALHPLGTPTALMEFIAEHEPRHPRMRTIIPIVLFIPGTRPPQTSRLYLFLDQERLQLDFYRGEEI
jgi:hypothetical protein